MDSYRENKGGLCIRKSHKCRACHSRTEGFQSRLRLFASHDQVAIDRDSEAAQIGPHRDKVTYRDKVGMAAWRRESVIWELAASSPQTITTLFVVE